MIKVLSLRIQLPLYALVCAFQAHAVELSGRIVSSTGKLPPSIEVIGARAGSAEPIKGKVENGRYRIEVPDTGMARLRLQAEGWDAAPKIIFDPKATGALDFLIYPAKVPEPALAAELIAMGKLDQEVRRSIQGMPDKETLKRMAEVDRKHEARLAAIIDEKGWPLISMVGYEAAKDAWLIAQHGTPAFLHRCVALMQKAAEKNEIELRSLALSIDRDLVQAGKKQIYGSQAQFNEDGTSFFNPIEDEAHLDQRRAAMGMEPFAQYKAMLMGK